jgi:hypothetical protein
VIEQRHHTDTRAVFFDLAGVAHGFDCRPTGQLIIEPAACNHRLINANHPRRFMID